MSLNPLEDRYSQREPSRPGQVVAEILLALRDKYFPASEINSGCCFLFDSNGTAVGEGVYKFVCFKAADYVDGMLCGVPSISLSFLVSSDLDLLEEYRSLKSQNKIYAEPQSWPDRLRLISRVAREEIEAAPEFSELVDAVARIFRISSQVPQADAAGWEPPSFSVRLSMQTPEEYLLELLTRKSVREMRADFEQMLQRLEEQPWHPHKESVVDTLRELGLPAAPPEGGACEVDAYLRIQTEINIRFGVPEVLASQIDPGALSEILPEFDLPD